MATEIHRKALRLLPVIVLATLGGVLLGAPTSASADDICIPLINCPPPPTGPPGGSPAPPTPEPPKEPCKSLDTKKGKGTFVGVVAEDVLAGETTYRRCQLNAQALNGVTLIRQTFRWSDIETSPGQYKFGGYDEYVGALASHGITVLPILFDPPKFRARSGSAHGTYPPRKPSDMGRFASALVHRYGPKGSYWAAHPEVPKLPIRAWQVWNEPNIPPYWPTGPNPRDYTKLLKATASGIKRADRGAEVVTAGIPDSDLGIRYTDFIAGMYKAGAKSSFDTLAIHPYSTSAAGVVSTLSRARKLMNHRGDRHARIWVTEIGWATSGPATRFTFSQGGQANQISRTIQKLWSSRGRLRIRGLVYFAWKDSSPYEGRSDFWGYHTGLIDRNDQPKAGFYAFSKAALKLR